MENKVINFLFFFFVIDKKIFYHIKLFYNEEYIFFAVTVISTGPLLKKKDI